MARTRMGIMGGPMMGFLVPDKHAPVAQASSSSAIMLEP